MLLLCYSTHTVGVKIVKYIRWHPASPHHETRYKTQKWRVICLSQFMLMQKLISCMCHQFAQIAFFSGGITHTTHIKCEKWVNTFQSHPIRLPVRRIQTHNAWQPISLERTHLSLDFIYFWCCTHIQKMNARARGERERAKTTNDNDFVHTVIVTYVLTFSTIILGLCGIDAFLFPSAQKRIWIKRIGKRIDYGATSTCPFAVCLCMPLCDQNIFWCLHFIYSHMRLRLRFHLVS